MCVCVSYVLVLVLISRLFQNACVQVLVALNLRSLPSATKAAAQNTEHMIILSS